MLRTQLECPVIGMEPAVKPAAAVTRTNVIGVLATVGTLRSARFAALLERFGDGLEVVTEPCPGLVERVEQGRLADSTTREMVRSHLEPLLAAGADTVILGCTHYAFLRDLIEEEAGADIHVIDTGAAVARQVERRLVDDGWDVGGPGSGSAVFFTTGPVERFRQTLASLWPGEWTVAPLPATPD